MDSDVIGIIKDAEAKCEQQFNAEVEKSKESVRTAKVDAKSNADAKVAAFHEQCQKRLETAAESAKQSANTIREGNKAQCNALRDVANRNMQKSVDYILGRIVG